MVFGPIQVITGAAPSTDRENVLNSLARDMALAMDLSATDVESATLMCDGGVCTDPAAVAVMGLAPGTWFPTRGISFALLSSGTVTGLPASNEYSAASQTTDQTADQSPPRAEISRPTALEVLHGLTNTAGGDLVRLHLGLRAPLTATCMALDYTFYTVDLPYTMTVSPPGLSGVGDIFTAQVNEADLRVDGSTVAAPGNIAFNQQGQVVATSTMSPTGIYSALSITSGGNISGVFPLLQMRYPVAGGEVIDLYLSIQDMGDAFADSAVALDNFAWLAEPNPNDNCQPSPGHSGDSDEDGLPNGWEQYGSYMRDAAGKLHYLDLRAQGADPDVKDVFVHIDAMPPLPVGGFDPAPISQAIEQVIAAFARAPVDEISTGASKVSNTSKQYKGIQLHVDYSGRPLAEPPQEYLCGNECSTTSEPLWQAIHAVRDRNFDAAQTNVYHYGLFAHKLFDCTDEEVSATHRFCNDIELVSGISENILPTVYGASDFVVSLGDRNWLDTPDPMETQQAGTFMHELGHNLGLNHFGTIESEDPEQALNKPNHLSVMNYLYQTSGLVVSDPSFKFDYSRFNMVTLNENELTETEGIYTVESGIDVTYTMGVKYYCAPDEDPMIDPDGASVNWNCDEDTEDIGPENITGDRINLTEVFSKLAVLNEWDHLVFTGGRLYRQRSMLWPYIADRSGQDTEATFAKPQTEQDLMSPLLRRLIVPAPNTNAILDQRVIEEFIPKNLVRPRGEGIPELLYSLRDWSSATLPRSFTALLDAFIQPVPASNP